MKDMELGKSISRLPNEEVSFNPSDPESVDMLLSKYGPEGAYEIGTVLRKAAMDDIDGAEQEAIYEKEKGK